MKLSKLRRMVIKLEQVAFSLLNKAYIKELKSSAYFLKEVKSEEDLLESCLIIAQGDYQIQSIFNVPSADEVVELRAFNRVMNLWDLSKFSLDGLTGSVSVDVPRAHIRDFIHGHISAKSENL